MLRYLGDYQKQSHDLHEEKFACMGANAIDPSGIAQRIYHCSCIAFTPPCTLCTI